jgi:acyl carrier protein
MSNPSVAEVVTGVINRVLTDSGRPARQPGSDDTLTGTLGLDSLDLAVLVVGLEQALGVDPFRQGARAVRTYGELVELYTTASNASGKTTP